MTAELPDSNSENPGQLQRLKFWPNVQASFKHIRESVRQEGNNIRRSDPWTVWLLPALTIALVATTVMSGWARLTVGLLAYGSAVVYLLARIGIVRGMNHRQTNMVWHLLMASFTAGLLFAFTYLEILRMISPFRE